MTENSKRREMNSGPFGHEADGDNNNTPKYCKTLLRSFGNLFLSNLVKVNSLLETAINGSVASLYNVKLCCENVLIP